MQKKSSNILIEVHWQFYYTFRLLKKIHYKNRLMIEKPYHTNKKIKNNIWHLTKRKQIKSFKKMKN